MIRSSGPVGIFHSNTYAFYNCSVHCPHMTNYGQNFMKGFNAATCDTTPRLNKPVSLSESQAQNISCLTLNIGQLLYIKWVSR